LLLKKEGAGAASKVLPGDRATQKPCGSSTLIYSLTKKWYKLFNLVKNNPAVLPESWYNNLEEKETL
jgi:hypothetical protein